MSEKLNTEPRSFEERAADSEDRFAYHQAHSGIDVDPKNYVSEKLYLEALKEARNSANKDDFADIQAYLESRPENVDEVVEFTDDMIAEKRAELDTALFEDMLGKSDDLKRAFVMAKMVANIKRNGIKDVIDMSDDVEAQKHMDVLASIKQREDTIHELLESFLASEAAEHLSNHDKEMLALAVIDATESSETVDDVSSEVTADEVENGPAPADPAEESKVEVAEATTDKTEAAGTSATSETTGSATGGDVIPDGAFDDSAEVAAPNAVEGDPASQDQESAKDESQEAADDSTSNEGDSAAQQEADQDDLDRLIANRAERKKDNKGIVRSLGRLALKQLVKVGNYVKKWGTDITKAVKEEVQLQKKKIDKLKESSEEKEQTEAERPDWVKSTFKTEAEAKGGINNVNNELWNKALEECLTSSLIKTARFDKDKAKWVSRIKSSSTVKKSHLEEINNGKMLLSTSFWDMVVQRYGNLKLSA